MMIPLASVSLTLPREGEAARLVLSVEASRLCREGRYQAMPSHSAVAWLDCLRRQDMAEVRDFIERTRLTGLSLRDTDDQALLTLLRSSLRTRQLTVICEGSSMAGVEAAIDTKRRQVVRAIAKEARQGLSYGGRRYRLMLDVQLGRLADRDNYEVVDRANAGEILRALAVENSRPNLAQRLSEAADLLTPDWRPPGQPDGLVLLRRIIQATSVARDKGPALTPSQLKNLGKNHWIEIELVDLDGEPCSLPYRLTLPDQRNREGAFDADGFVGVYEIEEGTAKLFIDGPTDADDTAEFSVKVVDELGEPIEGVALSFSAGGRTLSATTGGDGVAKQKVPGVTSVEVDFENADDLAQTMASVWNQNRGKPRSDWVKANDTTSVVTLFDGEVKVAIVDPDSTGAGLPKETIDSFDGVETAVDKPATLSVQPLVIGVRMLGELFDTDKCFLLPKALDSVTELVKLHREYEKSIVLIVGHTDTSGQPDYNLDLSLERVSAMQAYLTDDADAWIAWYGDDKQQSKRWGETEDGYMIETLLEGSSYPSTVLGYQQWHNAGAPQKAGYESLDEDGAIGPLTRKQLVLDYMHREDTTVPEGTSIEVHGCGEYFPLDPTGQEVDGAPADGQHEQEDRRVEVYLFPKELGVLPPVPGPKATKGEKEYLEWRLRAVELTTHGAFECLQIAWDQAYGQYLPQDLSLELSCDGAVIGSITWSEAPVRGGERTFVFSPVGKAQATTLTAVTADNRFVLWEDQVITADDAITWQYTLDDLFVDVEDDDQPADGEELPADWHDDDDADLFA